MNARGVDINEIAWSILTPPPASLVREHCGHGRNDFCRVFAIRDYPFAMGCLLFLVPLGVATREFFGDLRL